MHRVNFGWGAEALSDLLRRSALCKCCGGKGADLPTSQRAIQRHTLAFHASRGFALRVRAEGPALDDARRRIAEMAPIADDQDCSAWCHNRPSKLRYAGHDNATKAWSG